MVLNNNRKEKLRILLKQLKIEQEVDLMLINQALTHPSYLVEVRDYPGEHNQRLEFLGDAVVGLVIARYLFQEYPHKDEGELTKMRAAIVCEASLAIGAQALQLGSYLQMGRGEEMMGGAKRSSNLADCFEAFMGALYLSLGLEEVRTLILKVLKQRISQAARGLYNDHKTQLQEYIQRVPDNRLEYRILQEVGPDHQKEFLGAVFLNEEKLAEGKGRTKKEAEQYAARLALIHLGVIENE